MFPDDAINCASPSRWVAVEGRVANSSSSAYAWRGDY